MSLPKNFQNNTEYFHESVLFLKTFQWLYRARNTHILVEKLFDQIPPEWLPVLNNLTYDELNKLPFGYIQETWPKSFREFIIKMQSLKPEAPKMFPKLETDLPQHFFKGLSQKKIHEILILAPFVHENCKKYNTKIIIDIGAGLGYLPQLLHKLYGYKIFAIDSNPKYIETALKRQKEIYSSSLEDVKYFQHFIDENSVDFLQKIIEKNNCNVCLIGLHACADLSVTLLKIFTKLSCVNQAIVMPCCYHRLKKNEGDNIEWFSNFPVSDSLRDIYKIEKAYKFLNGAFLRLACQNSATSWINKSLEDHKKHSVDAMRRNVLQLVAEKEGYHLARKKRKSCRSNTDFPSYLNSLKQSHNLTKPPDNEDLISSQYFFNKMREVWSSYEKDCPLMEAYMTLQTSLQSVCENLLLLDRVEMIKELGFFCFTQKITDDSVSPRCYALVARKQT